MTHADERTPMDEWAMGLAREVSKRSRDPHTKVGAVLLDFDGSVISLGFNQMPTHLCEEKCDWSRPLKYDWVIHAEMDALLNARVKMNGGRIYVTGKPCAACMRHLAFARVEQVIYSETTVISCVNEGEWELSMRIANACGMIVRKEKE